MCCIVKQMRRQRFLLIGVGLLFASALPHCQTYDFAYRPTQRVAITSIREVVVRNTDTDILFIVDNSNSMGEEQANLIRNTRLFIEELATSDNAYRVGVMTTNALDEDRNQAGPLGTDGGRLRLVRATQTQLNSANCNIAPDSSPLPYLIRPDPSDAQVDAKRCRLIEDFVATISSLGIQGSSRESALEAARRAFNGVDPNVENRNSGFLRDEADLALVLLTDEDDCGFADYGSDTWPNSQCYADAAQAVSVATYANFFAGLKGSGGIRKIRAALIGGGFVGTGESAGFEPSGCRLVGGNPSVDCGCWSSTDEDFFCSYLHDYYGHVCVDTTGCAAAGSAVGDTCASQSGGICNTDRCEALPAGRYHAFMNELGGRRLSVGFPRGTFEDSICRGEYDQTLLTIARTVVLSSCFVTEEPALGPNQVSMKLRHVDSTTGALTETAIPRYDAADSTAECQTCGGSCANGAWRFVDNTTFCLECGLKKQTGDEFILTVLNEVTGFDGGPQ